MGNKNAKSNFGKMGWALVIYCLLSYFIFSSGNCTMNMAVGVFESMYGWDQTYLLSLSSIGGWVAIVFIYVCGQLYAKGKLNIRILILVSGVVYAIGIFLWGQVTNLTVFTFVFVCMYIAYPLWGTMANNALCNNWFPHKKGVVIGWTTIGFPLGAGMGAVLFGVLNEKVGFSNTYLIFGIASLAICLFGFFMFTEYPEQRGCFPDNDKSMTTEQAQAELAAGQKMLLNSPWTTKRLLKTKEVWLIGIGNSYLLMLSAGAMGTMIPRLLASGRYSPDQAMMLMMVAAFSACPGSYLCGYLDAKTSPKTALIITDICCVAACILNVIPSTPALVVSLVLIGVGTGGSANFIMSMTSEYWGRYNFQKAYGTVLTINQLVGSAGPVLMAVAASKFNWDVSYIIMGVLAVLAILLVLPIKDGFVERAEERFAKENE